MMSPVCATNEPSFSQGKTVSSGLNSLCTCLVRRVSPLLPLCLPAELHNTMPEVWRLSAQSGPTVLGLEIDIQLSQIGRCRNFKSYRQIKYRTGSSLVV